MRDNDHIPVLLQPVLDVFFATNPPAPSGGVARGSASAGGAVLSGAQRTRAGSQFEPEGPSSIPRPLTLVDATAGLGGHAAAIAQRLPPGSTVVLNDLDSANLTHAAARVAAAAPSVTILTHRGNFAALPRWLTGQTPPLSADLLLADLGFASPQVDNASRGLSFLHDGPLDMRFNTEAGTTAADLIASLPEADLAQIIYEWGDERHSRAIARGIVEARKADPITTTARLGEVVRHALRGKVPPREVTGNDPATKTFQALRIAVNDEIGNLMALLDQIEKAAFAAKRAPRATDHAALGAIGAVGTKPTNPLWLNPGATLAFISFHSLEDRPVKQAFAKLVDSDLADEGTHKGKIVTADDAELAANPRARSAKLRAIRLKS